MKTLLKIGLAVTGTAILGYFLIERFQDIQRNVAVRDSIAYWSAGQLLAQGHDPYDQADVLKLEREHGYQEGRPLVLRTPPWSLWMVLPLGMFNPFGAWCLWIAICFGSLVVAMNLCRRLYGRVVPRDLFSVVGYLFAPIPACLVSGQMGLVLLLGIVLFLWWERKHPFLAGAALILPFAKPHLLSLFWVGLALWIVLHRKSKVAVGFMFTFVAAVAVALVLDPTVFHQYREMLRTASIGREFIPAFSGVIRLLLFRRFFWVQFVPLAIGLLWCFWFFFRRLHTWDWQEHGPALLVVSVLTTPYAWLADESVLLPAILQAAAFAYESHTGMKLRTKLILLIFALLNGLLLLILRFKIPFATGIYFWSSLVWFGWYFYARRLDSTSLRAKEPFGAVEAVQ
jgi:hypothetical protein